MVNKIDVMLLMHLDNICKWWFSTYNFIIKPVNRAFSFDFCIVCPSVRPVGMVEVRGRRVCITSTSVNSR